jgi:hypothetical protein
MRRVILWSVTFAIWQAVTIITSGAEPTKTPQKESLKNDLSVGEPIRYENLTIFPITSHTLRDTDRFITLDEGLKAGTVEVLEVGAVANAANLAPNSNPAAQAAPQQRAPRHAPNQSRRQIRRRTNAPAQTARPAPQPAGNDAPVLVAQGGGNDVNRLYVVNKSTKPLYLMPGEIIIGGSQDRTIGREYVLHPSPKPQLIEVFCVEHGRWGTRDRQEFAGLVNEATAQHDRRTSVAISGEGDAAELAEKANDGKFVGSVGKLSKGARIAVQEGKGQSAVWDEVGKENAKSKVTSKSGAFTGNYAEKEAVKRLDPYLAKFQSPVSETKQVVGVIVAVNDKMDSAEILESTPLFKKLWPKLLKSYALDAANANEAKQAKSDKACTRDEATAFLTELQNAHAQSNEKEGQIAITRHVTDRLSTSSAFDQERAPQGAAGGFGGGIHSSGFAK